MNEDQTKHILWKTGYVSKIKKNAQIVLYDYYLGFYATGEENMIKKLISYVEKRNDDLLAGTLAISESDAADFYADVFYHYELLRNQENITRKEAENAFVHINKWTLKHSNIFFEFQKTFFNIIESRTKETINWTPHARTQGLSRDPEIFYILESIKTPLIKRLKEINDSLETDSRFFLIIRLFDESKRLVKTTAVVLNYNENYRIGKRINVITVIGPKKKYFNTDSIEVVMSFTRPKIY